VAVNGHGHPLRLCVTAGQAGDAPQGERMLNGWSRGQLRVVVGDRGYDSNAIVRRVRSLRARVVIPATRNRTRPRRYSRALYRGRNVVERFWSRVKQYRRVATRYDKLDVCYLGFLQLASILDVLKHPATVHTT
jgi:transposase